MKDPEPPFAAFQILTVGKADGNGDRDDAAVGLVGLFRPRPSVTGLRPAPPPHDRFAAIGRISKRRGAGGRKLAFAACLALLASPLAAKDSLGVFGDWGAFRDPSVPRCYAIAVPEQARSGQAPFASVGTWPGRGMRGQLHLRLSRPVAPSETISLSLGGQRFELTGSGVDAWAKDRRMDAAVVAAMRSAAAMSVSGRDRSGRRFTDRYSLAGVATAMDAATVGCAQDR